MEEKELIIKVVYISAEVYFESLLSYAENNIDLGISVNGPDEIFPVTVNMVASKDGTEKPFSWSVENTDWQDVVIEQDEENPQLTYGEWQLEGTMTYSWEGENYSIPVRFMQCTENEPYQITSIFIDTIYPVVDGLKYEMVWNGAKLLGRADPNDTSSEVTVPDTIDGQPVVTIDEEAFPSRAVVGMPLGIPPLLWRELEVVVVRDGHLARHT